MGLLRGRPRQVTGPKADEGMERVQGLDLFIRSWSCVFEIHKQTISTVALLAAKLLDAHCKSDSKDQCKALLRRLDGSGLFQVCSALSMRGSEWLTDSALFKPVAEL